MLTKKIFCLAIGSTSVAATSALVSYLFKPNTPIVEKSLNKKVDNTPKSGWDFSGYGGEEGLF